MVQIQNSGIEECANKFQLQGMNGWLDERDTRKEGRKRGSIRYTWLYSQLLFVDACSVIFIHHTPQWIWSDGMRSESPPQIVS